MNHLNEKRKEVFLSKIEKTPTCWLWNGGVNKRHGYGYFKLKRTSIGAHRISYSIFKGDIPDGLHVLHTCDNKKCVNPDHLFLGNAQDNMTDKTLKGRASRKSMSSKYPGVGWIKNKQKWKAYLTYKGKTYHLGYFDTEEDAINYRISKAKEKNIPITPISK